MRQKTKEFKPSKISPHHTHYESAKTSYLPDSATARLCVYVFTKGKIRMGNFTPDVCERLIQLVNQRLNAITAKGNSAATNAKRDSAWLDISKILNAENRRSGIAVTAAQCKKKWQNLTSSAKGKNASLKKSRRLTGGGKSDATPLTTCEEKIVGILGSSRGWTGEPRFVESPIGFPRSGSSSSLVSADSRDCSVQKRPSREI